MAVIGGLLRVGAPNAIRTASLRAATGAIAAWGIHSLFVMGIGDRLIARPSIDFWDFQESTIGFFLHHIAILGTCACAAHYAAVSLRWAGGVKQRTDAGV
jgi:hypothetical protein